MQTMKKRMKILFFLGLFIISFIGISNNAEATNRKHNVVKAAWNTKSALEELQDNSNDKLFYGLINEYYEKIAEVTGLEFEHVPYTSNESLTMLQDGKVDVIAGIAYRPKRAELYTYIMSPMSFSTISLLEKENTEKLYYKEKKNFNYKTPKEFFGEKIGVEKKYISTYLKILKEKKINPLKLNLIPYSNYGVMKQDLLDGELDYIIGFTTFCDIHGLKETMRLKKLNLYFCVNRKKKVIIEKLTNGIRIIKQENPNYNEQLYNKYFGKAKNNIYYTPREKKALADLNELIFYVQKNRPLEYNKAANGAAAGYYAAYIKELASILGKKYLIIPVSQKILKESKMPGFYLPIPASDEDQKKMFFKRNPNYDPKYVTNVTREAVNMVCVKYGVTKIAPNAVYASNCKCFCEIMVEKGHKVIYVKNDFESLKLLSEEKVDVAIVDVMLTNYVNDLVKYKNIAILNFTKPINQSMLGINGIDDDVFSVVNKTISLIPKKDSKIFMANEDSNNIYKPNLRETLKNESAVLLGLGIIVLIVILIFINVLFKKNNKIRELAKEAIEAKKTKNSFLSRISHEMRTPLNAIISFADFGIEEKRELAYVNYFQKIKFSADTLLALMQDVLQLENKNTIENANEEVIIKNIVIRNKIDSIIRPLADAKNVEFEILFEQEVKYFKIDIKEGQQLLLNLLTNAIKYTNPGGKVTWQVKTENREGNKVVITNTISDNGVGISEEFQKQMFEPFTMENNELSKTEIGTGLGLAICKKNIEKLGGKISCKSKLGEGTTFTIEFEISIASEKEEKIYEEKIKGLDNLEKANLVFEKNVLNRKLKILLCEDVAINAQIVIKILTKADMDVDWVKNGKLGVEKAFENDYDAILMDIRMPVMDGLTATKLIREKNKKIVIIALSANVYESDKLKSLEAGMNDHLGKPINKKELLKVIYHLVYQENKYLEK